MKSYEAARKAHDALEFWARVLMVIGVLAAGAGGFTLFQMREDILIALIGTIPGVFLYMQSNTALANAQNGRAMVDTAEYSQQILKISRDQLEISKQTLKQGAMVQEGYAALEAAKAELENPQEPEPVASYANPPSTKEPVELAIAAPEAEPEVLETLEYAGRSIDFDGQYYRFAKMTFANLDAVHGYIDQLGVNNPPPVGTPTPA